MRIAVLNGPNLNLLGVREPSVYGATTLAEVEAQLTDLGRELGVDVECVQSNGEGALVDIVHGLRGRAHGAIVNAGAYSHTSLALRDALVGCELPFVEVHITNIYAREPERRHSMLAQSAIGVVVGLGTQGYGLALRGLVLALNARGVKT
ncbi:MAG: 3-dehydroquinate dehydratase [Gemmatimonadetes bacterium]|nr:3-dehydroquinate dehydratase [Gemmatimonadota bacterium]